MDNQASLVTKRMEKPGRNVATNNEPSVMEQNEVRRLIDQPQTRIRDIDAEISRLLAERDKLEHFVGAHSRVLSPIRRLPADILSEIFILCLPTDHFPSRDLAEAPLLLTFVCHIWRNVALRTPRLWNAIHIFIPHPAIDVGTYYEPWMQKRLEGIRNWLKQSGTLPLHLSLSTGSYPSFPNPDSRDPVFPVKGVCDEILSLLVGFSSRWMSLSLVDIIERVKDRLDELLPPNLPMLKAIQLVEEKGPFLYISKDLDVHTKNLLRRASCSLRDIRLQNFPTLRTLNDFPISWTTLTYVSLAMFPATSIPELATLTPALRTCSLEVDIDADILQVDAITPVEWPHLHTLILDFERRTPYLDDDFLGETDEVIRFLGFILTPALAYLVFKNKRGCSYQVVEGYLPPFCDLLSRSNCLDSLESLYLDFLIPDNMMVHTLQLLPGLTTLEVSNHAFHKEMWNEETPYCNVIGEETLLAITPSPSSQSSPTPAPACPALQVIRLANCAPAYAPQILNLAQLRGGRGQLKLFSIQFGDCSQVKLNEFIRAEETLAEVEELQRGEMVFEWKWDDCRIGLRDHDNALDGFYRFDDHLDSVFSR
ncbi:hypothetical protein AAF712_003463 [Marasmius tenuissimus]|uniref:F-box domain-containing protein n=1 Tax=Marasmius tenuissimus TaxID=585030 RepID=A0ABR3A8V7_9AGAR